MGRVIFRFAAATALLLGSLGANRISAAEVSIADLVKAVPVLSIKNEQLSSFRFTFETPQFGTSILMQFVYSKPDALGMMVSAGEERAPFIFLAQRKSMWFDVTTSTAMLMGNTGAKFVLRAEDDSLNISYSSSSQQQSEVTVDLPSLLDKDTLASGKLDRDGDDWRLTCPSKSGKSTTTAFFQSAAPHTIHKLEVRSSADDSLLFSVRDISINREGDERWPAFPAKDAFPPGIKVVQLADIKPGSVLDALGIVARWMRALTAQGALRNPEMRELPFFFNVNWAEAEQANQELGPPLRALFQMPAEPGGAVQRGSPPEAAK